MQAQHKKPGVLVTGAGGMLGGALVRELRRRGEPVRAMVRPGRARAWLAELGCELVEADLCDERSLRQACRGVERIVHAAALLGFDPRRAREQRQINVEGTARLYRAAHDHGVRRIVHVSSIAAVGATRGRTELDERATWNLGRAGLHYAATKYEAEERARAAIWAGMDVVIVSPGALFGPRPPERGPSSTVARLRARTLRWIPPGGTSVCDVEDVARACVDALERGRSGERYILAGHNVTWSELYTAIARSAAVRAPTRRIPRACVRVLERGATALELVGIVRPPWTAELFRSWGWFAWYDSGKARRELGYVVRPLEEIVERSLAP